MSIVLGVLSSIFLCLFTSICKRVLNRHRSRSNANGGDDMRGPPRIPVHRPTQVRPPPRRRRRRRLNERIYPGRGPIGAGTRGYTRGGDQSERGYDTHRNVRRLPWTGRGPGAGGDSGAGHLPVHGGYAGEGRPPVQRVPVRLRGGREAPEAARLQARLPRALHRPVGSKDPSSPSPNVPTRASRAERVCAGAQHGHVTSVKSW
eukprot:1187551-Prorocentrum_minimum.AAC.3